MDSSTSARSGIPRRATSFSTLYGSSGFFNLLKALGVAKLGDCFSTLYGSSGFFNRNRYPARAPAQQRFSTLYGSSGFFNESWPPARVCAAAVSVPSTGQVDSSTQPAHQPRAPDGPFQYPLRVKWILQRRSCGIMASSSISGFSTLYGSSGFFNSSRSTVCPLTTFVSVPSTGQVDSSTRVQRRFHRAQRKVSVPSTGQVDSSTVDLCAPRYKVQSFQYPLRVKWILQQRHPR